MRVQLGETRDLNHLFKYFHMPYSVSLINIDGTILLFGFIVFLDLSMTLYDYCCILSGLVRILLSSVVITKEQ